MYSFAIILSEEDLKVLISDFVEVLKEELGGRVEVSVEQVVEVLSVIFEEFLDGYEVDKMVVKVGGECREVGSSEEFIALVKEFYGDVMNVLSSGSETGGEGVMEGELRGNVVEESGRKGLRMR